MNCSIVYMEIGILIMLLGDMHEEVLSEDNFLLYAAKYYTNPSCYDMAEFNDDLHRFKYIKRLFNRFVATGDLKDRLILNHIIILYNVFGQPAATRMLFYKLDKDQWYLLKPFLVMLGFMPERIVGIGQHKPIINSDIPMNIHVIERLRQI